MNLIPMRVWALIVVIWSMLVFWFSYIAGCDAEREKWLLKTALQVVSNHVEIAKKTRDIRVLENRLASSAVEISTFHQGVMNEKISQKDRVIAGLHNGTVRLSIPVTSTSTTCQAGISEPASDRPQAAGETRAELSREASEFLIGIGHECDAVTIESNQVKDLLIDCRAALQKLQFILRE